MMWRFAFYCLLPGCWTLPLAWSQDPNLDDAAVAKLIDQLGHSSFQKREDASRQLAALGKRAMPFLKEATRNNDLEISTRARVLISRIEQPPIPGGPVDPEQPLQLGDVQMRFEAGVNTIDIPEGNRRTVVSLDGITLRMTVAAPNDKGVVERQTYQAQTVGQLRRQNPQAYALYRRYANVHPALRMGGMAGVGVNEVDVLRLRMETQMRDAKLADADRQAVLDALNALDNTRQQQGLDGYVQKADEVRTLLEKYKLDCGDLLPPPANRRLGATISGQNDEVVIDRLEPNSRGERIGLLVGDVIDRVDGKDIATINDLRRAVSARDKGLVVDVVRGGRSIRLEEKPEK